MINSFYKFILSAAAIALLGAGCSSNLGTSVNRTKEDNMLEPKQGTTITLKDCKATPTILQIREGKEVVFKNSDAVEHTLFIDGQNQTVAANGELKVLTKFSLPAPVTMNYMCDGRSLGDAIFVTR